MVSMAGRRYYGGFKRRSTGHNSRRSTARKPKGQTSGVVQYSIKSSKGSTKYIGTTNNPRRRAAEHIKSGKLRRGDKLVVETRAVSRKSAESVEAGKLRTHRRQHGQNPKHNATNDGRFHRR